MRKILKKQIFSILQKIESIIDEFKKMDNESIINSLADFQQTLVRIGTIIENECGEDFITVHIIEEYLELLYQTGLKIDDKDDTAKNIRNLKKGLISITNSIRNDIKTTYEIFFLPYKASMWDSFDSVYREAVKSPVCRCNVMPIPYYNISVDGKALDSIYEGYRFPIDIPIVNYQKCNIADICPDVIFIHNPYDEYNNVTSIYPQYYSSELCKITEHLVYIPYDIMKWKYRHMCELPGVKNSWRTFVQSESVRETYIKYNDKKKIIAFGSPKIDMILNAEKNKPPIPEEWKTAFEGKKVFLLNTHLNTILTNPQYLTDKIKQVTECFKNRNDIALLWRPHPLSIESLRSRGYLKILKEYLQLIDDFKKSGIGIYDDTSDVSRAIAISDAYIGDGGSLEQMYNVTKKPMYMLPQENKNINGNSNINALNQPLLFQQKYFNGNDMYAVSDDFSALFKCDCKTKEVSFINILSKNMIFRYALYSGMFEHKGKLYIFPNVDCEVVEYNLSTGEMKYYSSEIFKKERYNIPLRVGNTVYMIPEKLENKIISFDLEEHRFSAYDTPNGYKGYSRYMAAFDNNTLYIVSSKDSRVVMVNTDTMNFEDVTIDCCQGYKDIVSDGEYLWLLACDGKVLLRYNKKSKEKEEYHFIEDSVGCCSFIKNTKDSIWLTATDSMDVLRFYKDSGKCVKLSLGREDIHIYSNYKPAAWLLSRPSVTNDKLFFNSRRTDKIITIDINTNEIAYEDTYRLPNGWYDEYCRKYAQNHFYLYNNQCMTIGKFIDFVADGDITENNYGAEYVKSLPNSDGTAGKKIWEYIFEELEKEI